MAKAQNNLNLEGTINGMTFYTRNGKTYVRRKPLTNPNRYKTDRAYQRVRENNAEFTYSATMGKLIRYAVKPFTLEVSDNTLVPRLTKVLMGIRKYDKISRRGERKAENAFHTPDAQNMLRGFEFNLQTPLKCVLSKNLIFDIDNNALSIPKLKCSTELTFPLGATHFDMQLGLAQIDIENNLSQFTYSNIFVGNPSMAITDVNLVLKDIPDMKGIKIYLFKIEFYQEINEEKYKLYEGNFNSCQIIGIM